MVPAKMERGNEDDLIALVSVSVVITGHQTEEGARESSEAAVGAGEARRGEEADGGLPTQGGTRVRVRGLSSQAVGLLLLRLAPRSLEP
jgi:hypothetical protein